MPTTGVRRRREVQGDARQIGGQEGFGVARPLAPNTLTYHACISAFCCAEEVHVVQRDRRRLRLVLDQLHLHVVRAHHERDRRRLVLDGGDVVLDHLRFGATSARGDHRIAAAFTLSTACRRFGHGEPDVVDAGALGAALRRLLAEEDQHVRELDDLEVLGADLDGLSAKGRDEELLRLVDVGDRDVMMPVDDRAVLRGGELCT